MSLIWKPFEWDTDWPVEDHLLKWVTTTEGMVGECPTIRCEIVQPKNYSIRQILANHKKNKFTVVWDDGTHTTITLQEGDTWDDEKALAMCFVKKLKGNKGSFNEIFTKELPLKLKRKDK